MRKSCSVLFCSVVGILNTRQGSESLVKQCPSEIGCHLLLSSFHCYFSSSCLRRMPVSIHLVTLTRCVSKLKFMLTLLFMSALNDLELQPTFSSQPSNPSTVEEGGDLILQWNFTLDGQSNLVSRILNVTADAPQNVAIRQNDDNATVEAGFENLFRATITDTQATLTILAVAKSINGEIYQLRILTASPDFFTFQSADVKISVLCKYTLFRTFVAIVNIREF